MEGSPGEPRIPTTGTAALPAGRPGARIAANAAWVMGAELVGKVASFVLVVVLARGLGATQYGYFTFGMAFIPLFLQLARWGIDTTTIRAITSAPDDDHAFSAAFVNGLAARSALAVAGVAISVVLSPLFVHGRQPLEAVAIVAGALLIDEIRTYLGAAFIAFEKMRFNALTMLVNRVLSTALAVVAIKAGGGLVLVCATYLLGSLGSLVSGWIAFVRFFPPIHRRDLRRSVMRALIHDGAAFGVASFLNMAAFRIDAVILEAIKGPEAVGIYGVAYRFFEPLLFVTWGVSTAAFPRLVTEHESGHRGRTYEFTLAATMAFYLPVLAGAPFATRWLIIELFSPRYAVATAAAIWLTSSAIFYGVAHLARMSFVAANRRREIVWVAVAVLSVNVIANLVVIPKWSYTGAAAVTFVTEVVEAALLVGLYARRTGRLRSMRVVSVPILASGAMAAGLAAGHLRGGGALAAGTVIYFLALLGAGRLLAPDVLSPALRSARARLGRPGPAAPENGAGPPTEPRVEVGDDATTIV